MSAFSVREVGIHPALAAVRTALQEALPPLAAEWVKGTQEALRAASAKPRLGHDRLLLFVVADALRIHAPVLETAVLRAWLSAVQSGTDPRAEALPRLEEARLDKLCLVDERQAQDEIELARIVQQVEHEAEWELREWNACVAALMAWPGGAPHRHPFEPRVFARALGDAVHGLGLRDDERRCLLRHGAPVLATALKGLFAQACLSARQHGVSPQPYRAVPQVKPVSLAQSMQLLLRRQPTVAGHGASPPTAGAIEGDTTPPQREAWVAALFAELQSDPKVPTPIKALIVQLQPALRRLVRADPQLLRSTRHPAWQLIDEIAQHARGYARTDPEALPPLAAHLQPVVQSLAAMASPKAEHFDAARQRLRGFVEARTGQLWRNQAGAMAALQQTDERLALEPMLRQQLSERLRGAPLDDNLKGFLLGPWVDVLAQVLASPEADEARTESLMGTVDQLLHVLKAPESPAQREAQAVALPDLMRRLRLGMDSVGLSLSKQEAVLESVLRLHAECMQVSPLPSRLHEEAVLPGQRAERSASGLPEAFPVDMPSTVSATGMAGLGMTAFADVMPHGHVPPEESGTDTAGPAADTDLGSLPTVPMPLEGRGSEEPADTVTHPGRWAEAAAEQLSDPVAWTQSLQVGSWCKLSLNGEWCTAQLLWISGNREFFVFKGSRQAQLQSTTRKALMQLRAEGLATQLEERALVQRALDSMVMPLRQ